MKLILHLGAHKTGTSAIQGFLDTNHDKLIEKGWEFIKVEDSVNLGNCISFWKYEDDVNFSIYEDKYQALINKLSENNFNKIISSEDMFFINDKSMVERLCNDIKQIFDDIDIVIYLRNQVDMALSNKAQGAKTNQSALLFGNDYKNPLPIIDKNIYEYLDYYSKIEMWGDCLPEARLIVRTYSRRNLVNEDSVFDFIDATGIPIEPIAMGVNESIGSILTNILHGLRESSPNPDYIWELFREGYFADLGGDSQLPSIDEAERFMQIFEESNKNIEKNFGVSLSLDLKKLPSERRIQKLIYEDVYKVLAPIINQLRLNNNDYTVDLIRDAAVLIENINIKKSYELMKIAHTLRPEGQSIKNKLSKIEKKLNNDSK